MNVYIISSEFPDNGTCYVSDLVFNSFLGVHFGWDSSKESALCFPEPLALSLINIENPPNYHLVKVGEY